MSSYSLVMIHTILPFFIMSGLFFIFRWLHSDNITYLSNTNAIDTYYTAIFLLFSLHVSIIPCRGWDRQTNKLASFSKSQNHPAMKNIKPNSGSGDDTKELIDWHCLLWKNRSYLCKDIERGTRTTSFSFITHFIVIFSRPCVNLKNIM